jgi:S1-C subfamily serine protease
MKKFLMLLLCSCGFATAADYSAFSFGPNDLDGTGYSGNATTASQYQSFVVGIHGAGASRFHDDVSVGVVRGSAEASIYQKVSAGTVIVTTESGLGSGALITPSGHIVSNAHVVGDSKKVKVFFKPLSSNSGGSNEVIGTVLKVNEISDLALIKVDAIPPQARPIPMKADSPPSVGEDAHAVGHPRGQTWTYTRGYVSQVRDGYEWRTDKNSPPSVANVIQTQTPINPGNSGGPLVDSSGALIGLNSFGDPKSPGLNFAVASSTIKSFLSQQGSVLKQRSSVRNEAGCGKTPVGEKRLSSFKKHGPARSVGFDPNCKGRVTMLIVSPDDVSAPIYLLLEHPKHPNMIGAMLVDVNRDGQIDLTFMDLNGDGRWDVVGENKSGEFMASDMKPMDRG